MAPLEERQYQNDYTKQKTVHNKEFERVCLQITQEEARNGALPSGVLLSPAAYLTSLEAQTNTAAPTTIR